MSEQEYSESGSPIYRYQDVRPKDIVDIGRRNTCLKK